MPKMTDEFAEFILSDGAGYISYWADIIATTCKADGSLASITLNEIEGDLTNKTITVADVKTAANKLLAEIKAGKFGGCCMSCTDEFLDFEGYDLCTADATLQIAALGEVIYG